MRLRSNREARGVQRGRRRSGEGTLRPGGGSATPRFWWGRYGAKGERPKTPSTPQVSGLRSRELGTTAAGFLPGDLNGYLSPSLYSDLATTQSLTTYHF